MLMNKKTVREKEEEKEQYFSISKEKRKRDIDISQEESSSSDFQKGIVMVMNLEDSKEEDPEEEKDKKEKKIFKMKQFLDPSKTNYEYVVNPEYENDINFPHFMDFESIDPSKQRTFSNVEIILSLIEIAQNKDYYSIPYSAASKLFWMVVIQYKKLQKVFENLQPETLKKYWILIRDAPSLKDFCEILLEKKTLFNRRCFKVRTIIRVIVDYLINKAQEDIEDYVKRYKVREVRERNLRENKATDFIFVFKNENEK